MLRIGLTGRACSGKNVVAKMMEEEGFEGVDVDKLGWPVLEASHPELIQVFGKAVIKADGTVDHLLIREAMFKDPSKRKALEDITHPKIVRECLRLADEAEKAGKEWYVWNAPLLQRVRLDVLCDLVVFVDSAVDVRFRRAVQRDGMDKAAFERRDASQWDVDPSTIAPEKLLLIRNDDGLETLHRQVLACCARIKRIRKG